MKVPNPASVAAAACSAYQSRISCMASSLQPRVLVQTRGSGNYGESGPSAFYTFDQLPSALVGSSSATANNTSSWAEQNPNGLERVDLDLGPDRLAFTIDNVLTADEADALASCAEAVLESNGHSRVAPGIHTPPGMRINEAAHWYPPTFTNTEEAPTNILDSIFQRIQALVPATLDGMSLYPRLSEKVAQFKYAPGGDKFSPHIDGLFPGQGRNTKGDGIDEWQGVVSGLSLLLYLNDEDHDGLIGGQTRLWSADGSHFVDVTPQKGRLLAFRRGSPNAVLHAGLEVDPESAAPKYMALVNLAYGTQTGTRPLRT